MSEFLCELHWWLKFKSPIYVNSLNIKKLFKEWKSAEEFFEAPKFRYWGKWHTKWTNILRVELNPLSWKIKEGKPVHEENPSITLTLFGTTWRWVLSPDKDENGNDTSVPYYETILSLPNYIKKHNDTWHALYDVIKDNTWGDELHPVDCVNMLNMYSEMFYRHVKAFKNFR